MTNNKLTIIQHNVPNWNTNKHSLINYYLQVSPEITLINSHGVKSEDYHKIPGYKIYKINTSEALADGSAIAVKSNVAHKLYDDFDKAVLAIEVRRYNTRPTNNSHNLFTTTKILPSLLIDFHRLLNNNTPTYILGDLNFRHRYSGNSNENPVGKSLVQ